jgi:hypothetical protein
MTGPGADLPALESLDDAGLQTLIRRAGELLQEREHERKRDAIERARAILAEAGLSAQDMLGNASRSADGAGKGGHKAGKRASAGAGAPPAARKGVRYANPANPSQIHERGRGREPNWFKALRESGALPDPIE